MNISIVKKAIKGDDTAFCQLIEERKEQSYRIAFGYVKNKEDALDIVGETVYKAFTSIKKLKHPQYFNTWFIKILINCAIDHLNKAKKIIYIDQEDTLENLKQQNNAAAYYDEDAIDLYAALDKLDEKHKTVVILKYFKDLTIEEIARVLEWPTGTVKTYLYRALKNLNLTLKEGDTNDQ